jgi:glycosyltransferase involved in cell wall biosynthesis
VRELVVADGGSSDATLEILEEAGAHLVEGGLDAACAAAKGPWLLIMPPTGRLPYEWVGPVRRVLESGVQRPVKLVRGLFARSEALLIPKAAWAAGKKSGARLRV